MKNLVILFSGITAYLLGLQILIFIKGDMLTVRRRIETLSKNSIVKTGSNNKESKANDQNLQLLAVMRKFLGGKILSRVASNLEIAGIALKPEEFFAIWLSTSILPATFAILLSADLLTVGALILAGLIVPPVLIARIKNKKIGLFETQLGDSLSIIGNCIKSGFTFYQSIESIVNEMPDPISKEFGKVLREVRMGISMEKALLNMVVRLKNDDLELLVSAINIQRLVGGNLAEILESIDATLKERIRIKGEIKVLTATGRISGTVIGLIPVAMLGALMLINPSYVRIFFETQIGIVLLVVAAIMEFIGFMVVKKIIDIKF